MLQVYLIFQSGQSKMNASIEFGNISKREKAKNHGLKHITFRFSEV